MSRRDYLVAWGLFLGWVTGVTLLVLLVATLTGQPLAKHTQNPASVQAGVSVPQTSELVITAPILRATPPKTPTVASLRPEPEPETPAPQQAATEVRQGASQQVTTQQATPTAPAAAPAPAPAPEPDLASTVSSILGDYGCGGAYVSIQSTGWQAQADWYDYGVIVNPDIPRDRLRAIVAHECAHLVQYQSYGGGINDLARDADRVFGGNGTEQLADCMAQHWGQVSGYYTTNCGGERGTAAALVASGQRINADY